MATTRDISYEADGRTMVGTLALPEGTDLRPGVLVCHEGPGLDDHARSRAVRLADELGYVAFALDYHGGGQPLADRRTDDGSDRRAAGRPARAPAPSAPPDSTCCGPRRAPTAIAWPPSATASAAPSPWSWRGAAPTSRRSSASTPAWPPARPEDARNIRGKVLALIGADDPIVDNAQRRAFEEEMRAGGVDWQLHVYGGAVHSFTNPRASGVDLPGIDYHEPTDRRSWQAMLDLFHEVFG